jgi:plasmid stabilization system protein ParE
MTSNASPTDHQPNDLDALEASLVEADPAAAPDLAEEIAAALDESLDSSGTETPKERHF